MIRKPNAILIILTLMFGVMIGSLSLILSAWKSGFLQFDHHAKFSQEISGFASGMQQLDSWTCLKGETKHILLGGVEDGYSRLGDETIEPSQGHVEFLESLDSTSTITAGRSYDVDGADKQLIDRFNLPTRIASGLYVVKTKSVGGVENDTLKLIWPEKEASHTLHFNRLDTSPKWQVEQDILSIPLNDLIFTDNSSEQKNITSKAADIFAEDDENRSVFISIGDDHIVDFMGFALCTAPNKNNGLTFQIDPIESDEQSYVRLGCKNLAQTKQCDLYVGNLDCKALRPLTCFREGNATLPQGLQLPQLRQSWTGGEIKFSSPVSGNKFKTQDEATAFCKAEFGENWRTLDMQDGFLHFNITAMGSAASGQTEAWVDARGQPYTNCWAPRESYEDYTQLKKTP